MTKQHLAVTSLTSFCAALFVATPSFGQDWTTGTSSQGAETAAGTAAEESSPPTEDQGVEGGAAPAAKTDQSLPDSVPELRGYALSFRESDPARHRQLMAEVERFEKDQATADLYLNLGTFAGGTLLVLGAAIVTIGQKQCEDLSSARAEADCLKAPLAPGFAVGVLGAVVAVGGFVGFAANTPSSEEIGQAASASTPQVEIAVELDPDAQHYGGSLRVTF